MDSNKGLNKKDDSRGEDDFWVIKLNAKGDEEWQKTIGGESQEKLQTVLKDKDGGYIIAPTHALTFDIPAENILAMVDVFQNQQKYF